MRGECTAIARKWVAMARLRRGEGTPPYILLKKVVRRAACPHAAATVRQPHSSRVVEDADPYSRRGFTQS